jgi:hypothetical protein
MKSYENALVRFFKNKNKNKNKKNETASFWCLSSPPSPCSFCNPQNPSEKSLHIGSRDLQGFASTVLESPQYIKFVEFFHLLNLNMAEILEAYYYHLFNGRASDSHALHPAYF